MESVPNIVRERLKTAASDTRHPDADVLTALAEQSLPARERATVIEHLARCGDCRDVLALALPEGLAQPEALAQKELVEAAIRPSPVRWLTWPALRWGLVAAGVAVIVSFGVFGHRHPSPEATMIAKESRAAEPAVQPQVPGAVLPSNQLTPNSEPKIESAKMAPPKIESPKIESKTSLITPPSASGRSPAPQLGARLKSPAMARAVPPATRAFHGAVNFGTPAERTADVAANANVPKTSQTTVEVSSAAPLINPPTQAENVDTSSGQVVAQLSSSQLSSDESLSLSKAKPATAPPPISAGAMPLPRWTISPQGGLQRSLDQGSTWQDVDVTSAAIGGTTIGGPLKKTSEPVGYANDTLRLQRPTFRAVAATGADVWAGGSGSVLYHSIDAGGHWIRVVPSTGATVLTGDIIRLEFLDAQHGRITTSTEIWTTSDDGQTWQKQ
jgi:hypothetical protein